MIMSSHSRRLAAAAAVLLLLTACLKVPTQTPTMKEVGVEHVTATQLREMVLVFATQFGQAVEYAADSIIETTDDPAVRYRALLWKSVVVTTVREAALISDPLLALVDVWLYTIQLTSFMESPPPAYGMLPGSQRGVALGLARDLRAKARDLAVRVVGEETAAMALPRIEAFAAAHPIDPMTLNRTSILAADSLTLRSVGGGIGGAIGATYWSMRDLADRAGAINDALGKELRWNLELMVYELAQMPVVDSTLTSLRSSLDRIAALADTLPPLVSGERAAVLDALHTELVTLTRAIDAMRVETIDAVTVQRIAVLEALTIQRVAVLAVVHQQRVATLMAMDSIVTRAIDESNRVVDHIFWRAFQLMAVLGVGVVLLVLLVLRGRRDGREHLS
ncbi:MAG: hypothetical protein V3T74_02855 [Gemmatimonadales bacterium]